MRPDTSSTASRAVVLYALLVGLFVVLTRAGLAAGVTDQATRMQLEWVQDGVLVLCCALLIYLVLRRTAGTIQEVRRAGDARLLDIIEISANAAIVVDEEQRIVQFNRTAQRFFGYQPEEVLGQPLDILLPPRFTESHRQHVRAFAAAPETSVSMSARHDVWGRRKDGSEFPAEGNITKYAENGRPHFMVTLRDISERRRLEERLRQAAVHSQVLSGISQSVAEVGSDYEAVLDTIARRVAEVVGDTCVVTLLSDDEQSLAPVAFHHPDPETAVFMRQLLATTDAPVSISPAGQVVQTGQALLIPRVDQQQLRASIQPDYWPYLDRFGIYSLLIVPMRARGRAVGTLGVTRDRVDHPYTADDQALLENLANRAALAIANAHLSGEINKELAERRQMEKTLRETRDQLDAILQGIADGVSVLDADGQLIYANNAAAISAGYPSAEQMVQDVRAGTFSERFDLLDESRQPFAPDQLPGRLALRGVVSPPTTICFRDRATGEERLSVVQARPILDERGKVRLSVSIAHDVTRRRRGEAALKESEERYRSIIAVLDEGIVLQGADSVIRACNPSAERILGLTTDQMMGRTSLDARWRAVHADSSPYPGDAHPSMLTLRTGKPMSNEVMGVHKPDGTLTWISINSQPLWHEGDASPRAVVTSFTDITERVQSLQVLERRVEERTRELERRRRMAEGLRDIVAVINSNRSLDEILEFIVGQAGRLLHAQAIAVYLVQADGRLHQQTAGGAETELPADITFAVGEGPLGRAVLTREPVTVADIGAELAVASDVCANPQLAGCWERVARHHRTLLALPIAVEDETHGGVILFYPDERGLASEETRLAIALSEQAALAIENARLHQQEKRLAVVNERHRLAQELHDSVTQLLFSQTLLAEAARRLAAAGDLTGAQAHLAQLGTTAQQSLKEMRLLVYQLRPPALDREGLVGALQQRLDAVERRAGVESRLLVEGVVQLPSSTEHEVYRIAREALNNALKHATATSVAVHIRDKDGQLELEVADNGKGFDPGSVADKGGMGLAGMRERAERLGGSLTIESAPGCGTRVKLSMKTRDA